MRRLSVRLLVVFASTQLEQEMTHELHHHQKTTPRIFYKDWGPKTAQLIVFYHGWPLSSDDWDAQMLSSSWKGATALSLTTGKALLVVRAGVGVTARHGSAAHAADAALRC